eukprot:scaffold3946_cov177-Amphora_coffeaeformis.AAC.3
MTDKRKKGKGREVLRRDFTLAEKRINASQSQWTSSSCVYDEMFIYCPCNLLCATWAIGSTPPWREEHLWGSHTGTQRRYDEARLKISHTLSELGDDDSSGLLVYYVSEDKGDRMRARARNGSYRD